MNRYIFLRRLTGPAILLLLGIVALLNQAHVVRFEIFGPLLLILLGVLKLAERVVLSSAPYPGDPYPSHYPGTAPPPSAAAAPEEPRRDREGGIL